MKISRYFNCLTVALLLGCSQSVKANPLNYEGQIQEQKQIAQVGAPASQDVRSFFETGRLLSEDRLLFRSPPDGVIPVRKESANWQFIIFKQGGVSFWMPPGVLIEEEIVLDTTVGKFNFRTLAANAEDRRYLVAYAHSLTEEQIKNPQVLLAAIRDRAAPVKEFKLIEDRSVNLDEYPGRELSFENADENITIRAYLVKNRVYVLGVRYPKSSPQPRQKRAFLNALQLLNR